LNKEYAGKIKLPLFISWSLIIRASRTTLATKLHKAAMACKEGPTGGQCLQAAPQADPVLTSGSRALERGISRSISKSICLPRRYPSLAKFPVNTLIISLVDTIILLCESISDYLPNLKMEANARKGSSTKDVAWRANTYKNSVSELLL
jgi:hypothetical protein